MDGITSDIIKLEGQTVFTYLTNIFNNTLKTKQILDSWHEAKIVTLFRKGDPKGIKNSRPMILLPHGYKIFTRLLQNRIERTLYENQSREQAIPKRLFYIRPSASSKLNIRKVKWIQLTTMNRLHWLRESLWHSWTLSHLWSFEKKLTQTKYMSKFPKTSTTKLQQGST